MRVVAWVPVLPPHQHFDTGELGRALRKRRQLTRGAVDRIFDEAIPIHLLEAGGGELEQRRQHPLGGIHARTDRKADHARHLCGPSAA
jgi:hypothetical protein